GVRPLLQPLVDMWCAYAYRFELATAPRRCAVLGPGLVHNMWIGARTDVADTRAMSSLERAIVQQQAAINHGVCVAQNINARVVTHTSRPSEASLRQLGVDAAGCRADEAESDWREPARRLADARVATALGDAWAVRTLALSDPDMRDLAR